jgi:hypothetical protein
VSAAAAAALAASGASSSSSSSSSALPSTSSIIALELEAALEELAVPTDVYENKAIRAALFALRAVLMSAPEREVSYCKRNKQGCCSPRNDARILAGCADMITFHFTAHSATFALCLTFFCFFHLFRVFCFSFRRCPHPCIQLHILVSHFGVSPPLS